jgi:anti-sigma factor RsiW
MEREATMDDRRLMRLLHGELPPEEEARVRAALARDPAAVARLRELERLWDGLELPPPEAAPPGFAARVAARAAGERARRATPFGPAWARVAAGAVLVAGMAAGASVGLLAGSAGEAAARDGAAEPAAEWTYLEDAPSSLAESYWSAVTGAELEEER